MDNIETFHNTKTIAAEIVGFAFEADLSKSVPMFSVLVVMDNTETFHNEKKVVAATVGFIFEADFFKSVQIIQGSGGHEHVCYVSP